ncbi:DUF2267 domain-containing protein [Dactylosporangium sp. CA-092794]|uniref:DUF2267 domain-containing protein n=1 Tax=Dactylosporangium sp. CA-092794 TaxID=3239929 RepID=UPI003D90461F
MAQAGPDPFNHALHTANVWLADIAGAFDTGDRRYTQRALRAWLHALRDRLTVTSAAKFGAQLPELLRGIYYDGWAPSKVPVRYGVEQYLQRFAAQSGISPAQVPATAATITQVIGEHMSPGQLAESLSELPADLRAVVTDTGRAARETAAAERTPAGNERMARLEDQVGALTTAVRALAHGLEEERPTGGGAEPGQVSRAARLADEILIAAGAEA